MITAKQDKVKLNYPFISFVKEGFDYETEILFYCQNLDFTSKEYQNVPRHKCVQCSLEEYQEMLVMCDIDWYAIGRTSGMEDALFDSQGLEYQNSRTKWLEILKNMDHIRIFEKGYDVGYSLVI